MNRISHSTVQRILDATDIVEVVSDFVSLKRRGANWVGLCPFHNDRSPSFYVSKTKGMCKCFSCGEGGSAVSFLMKLEQLSYSEALKYLARKYNIEVEERQMTPEEQRAETARESMMALNDFAMRFFEQTMKDTERGRDVGLSYFRYRGISDAMIERFHLGFAPEGKEDLYREALRRGYSEDYIIDTGLCYKTEDGRVIDRFRGRVIYPVLSLSGKVVAFGGRTLRKEKTIAKYVNSPESLIYSKRRELYGIFQSKQAIAKEGKCIIVEGYMDVISMHQAGVCNVVASSGTALTIEQVKLIKRFTRNVTLIYDADAAGIKAALRGIELLLQEDADIKVLLLPPGEDPDSFAQSHSSSEVMEYIAANETDFVTFMARILLGERPDDPTHRAAVITRVVKTIALIPNEITRSVYIQECSRILFIAEDVLRREVGKYFNEYALKSRQDRERAEVAYTAPSTPGPAAEASEAASAPEDVRDASADGAVDAGADAAEIERRRRLRPAARGVARLVVRYANYPFAAVADEEGNTTPLTVIDYVISELEGDAIILANPDVAHLMREAIRMSRANWEEDLAREQERLLAIRADAFAAGIEEIRSKATDPGSISAMEKSLSETVDAAYREGLDDFASAYLSRLMCSSDDDAVRTLATELAVETHILSKMHTKFAHIPTEREQLADLLPRAIHELKASLVAVRIEEAKKRLAACGSDVDAALAVMSELRELDETRKVLARLIGDRVITPVSGKSRHMV
ncbi:MAG: DNA primase [Duncaniella sp.]|nr:DNA primase [Duncaniella sp.]